MDSNITEDTEETLDIGISLDNKDITLLAMVTRGASSIPEMQKIILARSTATVHNRLKRLEAAELVTSQAGKSRSRKITRKGLDALLYCRVIDTDTHRVKAAELEHGINIQFPD